MPTCPGRSWNIERGNRDTFFGMLIKSVTQCPLIAAGASGGQAGTVMGYLTYYLIW